MITVPEATKIIVKRSRYLSEAISKDLINFSSLARYIKPEIEQMLIKDVSTSAIVMALKRIKPEFQPNYKNTNIFKSPPSITLQSSLVFISIPNKSHTADLLLKVLDLKKQRSEPIQITYTHSGVSILCSLEQLQLFHKTLGIENPSVIENVSSLSIKLPKEAQITPGIFYFFLKSLAWEGINIIEIFSALNEFTLVVSDNEAQKAFAIIKSLFSQLRQ